ncbi:hypothetical protein B566_EDAN008018 [Ephemera danica]|nr:hypothetical protein B566_EDAN008018 [Ephemera danica]
MTVHVCLLYIRYVYILIQYSIHIVFFKMLKKFKTLTQCCYTPGIALPRGDMLQQILRDLWVDPELLDRLDEDQKQQLFCHMREEQVRRWKIWDEEQLKLEAKRAGSAQQTRPSNGKKKVQFMLGENGEPWVWVMGEHECDKTIEQILEEEAREKALDLAKREAEELRKKLEAELLIEEDSWKDQRKGNHVNDVLDIYSSVDEIKETFMKSPSSTNNNNNRKMIELPESNNREVLQELKFNKKPTGVASRVAQWEQRLMEERSSQIFQTLQKKKQELVHEAEKDGQQHEELWREQARKFYSNYSNPAVTEKIGQTEPRPPNKEAIYEWFHNTEKLRQAGIDPSTKTTAPWFHGLISRQEAESLLKEEEVGAFLVRVSEKIWGYAISLKEEGRCKHYLVDAANGHYQFPGQNQITHKTLAELVSYHSWEPITAVGKELLRKPCAWNKPPEIFNTFPNQKT